MIEDLIRQARRRLLVNEAAGQLAFAASIDAGAVAVILIVGTRYLEWWTLTVVTLVAVALAGFRVARRIPDPYRLAQRIDRSAQLHDLLSTALHFGGRASLRPAEANVLALQRQQAEQAAKTIDLGATLPLRFPRTLYPLAALTLLASSLVVLRYALTRSLDLRPPLTDVLFEDQLARREIKKPPPPATEKSYNALKAAEALMAKLNSSAAPDEMQDPDALEKAIDEALAPPSSKNAANSQKASEGQKAGQPNAKNGADPSQDGDPLNGNQNPGSPDQNAKSAQSGKDGSPNEKGRAASMSESNNSSLLSRLKDAVSNMFSRGRQDSGEDGRKSSSQQQSQMAKADQKGGQKSQGGKGQQQADSQADAQEGDPNGDPQEGQQAEGKSAAKTSAQNSAQAGSGIGSQNGAKDLRAAEQLRAMGKITEIFGKRAASLTGETMVEVQSGAQQLRTSYTANSATHSEAISDVNRDEIPPALQTYVANYFEQVRKASPKPETAKSGAGPTRPARQ